MALGLRNTYKPKAMTSHQFGKKITRRAKKTDILFSEAYFRRHTPEFSGANKTQGETAPPQYIKLLLCFIFVIFFLPSSKAQLITRHVYIKLLHNNEIVSSTKILKKHAGIGDTIALSYNPTDHWFKCNKNHKSDTVAIVKGKRYECRTGVVVSKAEKRNGTAPVLNSSL